MGFCSKCGKEIDGKYTMCYPCKFPQSANAAKPAQGTPGTDKPEVRESDMKLMNRLNNRRTALDGAINWLSTLATMGKLSPEQLNAEEPLRLANKYVDWVYQGEGE